MESWFMVFVFFMVCLSVYASGVVYQKTISAYTRQKVRELASSGGLSLLTDRTEKLCALPAVPERVDPNAGVITLAQKLHDLKTWGSISDEVYAAFCEHKSTTSSVTFTDTMHIVGNVCNDCRTVLGEEKTPISEKERQELQVTIQHADGTEVSKVFHPTARTHVYPVARDGHEHTFVTRRSPGTGIVCVHCGHDGVNF